MPSDAILIRDATAALVSAVPLFEGRPVRKSYVLPTKDSEVPCVLVFFAGDTMTEDGDNNHGEPHFKHALRIAVSGVVRADDEAALDGALDLAMEQMLGALLTNPEWVNLSEAVTRIDRTYEIHRRERLLMAEARLVITLELSSRWPPVIPDDLDEVHVRSPGGDRPQTGFDVNELAS